MINLHHLRYFLDAATAGSLSVAAGKNRVSQSAVTQAVQALERSLGFALSTHQRKSFQLTTEGKSIADSAGLVFKTIEEMSRAALKSGSHYGGPLTIACTNSLAVSYVPALLSYLWQKYPDIQPILRIGNSETIQQWILERKCEVGFLVDDGNLPRDSFQKLKITSGRYLLFRSARESPKTLSSLVVSRSGRREVREILKGLAKNSSGKAVVSSEITSWEAIKAYVTQVGGMGICPDYVVRNELKSKLLKQVKVSFALPRYDLVAVWVAKKPLGRNAALLRDQIMKVDWR